MHRTKPIAVLGLCLLFLIVLAGYLVYLAASSPDKGPHSQTHHFGVVRAGQAVQHIFVIKNPTPNALQITRMTPSCACLLPRANPTHIPPRSSCEIPVLLKTRGRSGRLAEGILVSFGQREPIRLALYGHVMKDTPNKLTFPRLRADAKYETEFLLNAYPGEDLVVHRVEYDKRYFHVTYTAHHLRERSFKFTVQLREGIGCGPFDRLLTIHTNDSMSPIKHILISGYILKRVEAEPVRVAFGIIAAGEEKAETVKLFSPYGDKVVIDRIESSPGSHVEWAVLEDTGDRGSVKIEVRLKAPSDIAAQEVIHDELYIYAEAGKAEVRMDITVSALIRGG